MFIGVREDAYKEVTSDYNLWRQENFPYILNRQSERHNIQTMNSLYRTVQINVVCSRNLGDSKLVKNKRQRLGFGQMKLEKQTEV